MHTKDLITTPFDDAPNIDELEAAVSSWERPMAPGGLKDVLSAFSPAGSSLVRQRLAGIKNNLYRSQLEIKLISWLYDFIRANIKRGRIFDLHDVLRQRSADCLGYCKLFTLLGRLLGLDAGVVEVITDNAGRYVPHTATLVRLKNHRVRFVDLWYGSKNIKHKRLGLQLKRGGGWEIKDLNYSELSNREACYLPDSCVNAITLYIRGNRYLNMKDFDRAIECYSRAIELYPGNARFFYNRAVAYENSGEQAMASADYAQALRDEAAIIRVLAREHDEVTGLINLDVSRIDKLTQEMYLLHKGFNTGKEMPLSKVARKFGISEKEARVTLSATENRIAT